jgi:hypothetical protein
MRFKKNDSANLPVSKSTKDWKKLKTIVPRKQKKHKMLYITWKVGFLYYFTVPIIFTTIQNLFKTGVFVFKQIAKSIPTIGKNHAVIFF